MPEHEETKGTDSIVSTSFFASILGTSSKNEKEIKIKKYHNLLKKENKR